jgi:ABC-2 type transport system ATP-binding protein
MKSILKINQLTKHYGRLIAVKNLSFSVQKGKVYGLLGPNGSGKSTTLGMILNVVNKTSGSFEWFNGEVSTSDALKKIGAIIERPNFYPYLTAFQNLELVCKIKEISNENILKKLEIVGLYERKDDKFKTFSLGMKQRLAIASALLNNPEMLILDEPTNGLDPKGIHEIREIIIDIANSGTTIILASHLLDEVEKVCDHVIILQKGEKIYDGNVMGMSIKQNWFEILTDELIIVKNILEKHNGIDKIIIDNQKLLVFLNDNSIKGNEIIKLLVTNNIFIDEITKKQPSLEDEFLKITE